MAAPSTANSTLADAFTDAASAVDELMQEMTDWRDNLSNANMEHLPKYDEVSEAAQLLEDADLERRAEAVNTALQELSEGRDFVAGCPEHVEGQKCKRCGWDGVLARLIETPPLTEYSLESPKSDFSGDIVVATISNGYSSELWTMKENEGVEKFNARLEAARREWWKQAERDERRNSHRHGHRLPDVTALETVPRHRRALRADDHLLDFEEAPKEPRGPARRGYGDARNRHRSGQERDRRRRGPERSALRPERRARRGG